MVHGDKVEKSRQSKSSSALARIEFCAHCEHSLDEGSFVHGLSALQGVRDYQINGSVVYGVPNDLGKVLNANEILGTIVLCDRGNEIPLVQKIIQAQSAGALGIIIIDDDQCTVELECGRAGSPRMGGFAPKDDPETWKKVNIPAVLISVEAGARMRRLMLLERKELPHLGSQYLNRTPKKHRSDRRRPSTSSRRAADFLAKSPFSDL